MAARATTRLELLESLQAFRGKGVPSAAEPVEGAVRPQFAHKAESKMAVVELEVFLVARFDHLFFEPDADHLRGAARKDTLSVLLGNRGDPVGRMGLVNRDAFVFVAV